MANKIYFEMDEAERQLTHIYDSLDYAICTISEGLQGEFIGFTTEMMQDLQHNISEHLILAAQGVDLLLKSIPEHEEETNDIKPLRRQKGETSYGRKENQ